MNEMRGVGRRTSGRRGAVQFIAVALLLVGCDVLRPRPEELPSAPVEVAVFVASQNLPDLRGVWTYFSMPSESLLVFLATYGKPNDCQAGCFYSLGRGLVVGHRIGWMRIDDYDGIDLSRRTFFDVAASDSVLFRDATWTALMSRDPNLFWVDFLPLLVPDPDTPADVLHRIADRLHGWISFHVAWLLLERAEAAQDTTLFRQLSCLPVFQGDPYKLVRERARENLGDSFAGCGSVVVRTDPGTADD